MSRNSITRSILMLTLLAGGTFAFADPGSTPPPAKPEDALKGPAVPDRHVPGVDNGLGEKTGGGKKDGTAKELPIPQPVFMKMVDETLGASAAANLRLTDTQRDQVHKLNDEFTAKQRTFMQEHQAEIAALIKEHPEMVRILRENGLQVPGGRPGTGGPGGEGGKRPGGRPGKGPENQPGNPPGKGPEGTPPPGDAMQPPPPPSDVNPEQRAKLQEKIQELKANAPRAEDTRASIWAVLTKDQQTAVQAKVDAFKAEREKQQDERYKEREKKKLEERGQKGDTKKGIPGAPGGGPGGDFKPLDPAARAEVLKSLPQEAQDRIGKLPPEQQDRVLARLNNIPAEKRAQALEEMKRRLEGGGKGGKRPGQPAPPPDGEKPAEPK